MALARQPADSAAARLSLFGAFHLTRAGEPIRLPTHKAEALLAYLALFPRTHNREALAGLFWGDSPDEQARGSLRKALTALRRALGDDALLADRLTARLNPDYPLWVDALAFERHLSAGRPGIGVSLEPDPDLLSAVALYTGELLPGFYDDWVVPLRERYRELYLESALSLVQMWRGRSDYPRAVEVAQRVLSVDPANERAHQQLMFCYLALGRRSEALQQYEICRRLLREELAVAPSAETMALYRWLKEAAAGQPAAEARITNLPIPLSSFVGREAETAWVKTRFLRGATATLPAGPVSTARSTPPAVRLITLTGPGGSGKTRLAVQVGADLIDAFPDGVWWVELAGLDDAGLVPHAVAQALGTRESPDEPTADTLVAFLQARRLLLILDNCEHLVSAAAALADALLGRCPGLAILATSRQALGLIGEHALPVPALAVPRASLPAEAGALLDYEGIRLFVERATAINPAFALTAANAAAVRQVCARLDGIPLALELAAMWMRALPAEELAARLDDRFQLLTSGSRAAPPRHQTLRGVIDWSYDLLPAAEQVLFRRLAVFAGGCTPEAARHVLNIPESGASTATLPATLALLHRLVDKSLVAAGQERGQTRFTMLETIREYAREKLGEAGEMERARTAHLEFFARWVEETEGELRGPRQLRWLDLLDLELDNLRAALDWAAANDPQPGLRLVGASLWYWNLRGHWREGPMWMAKLLAAPVAAPTPARARALIASANLAHWGSNDYLLARDQLDEAVAILRASAASAWDLAYALALLGAVRLDLGDPAAAAAALEESLALGESLAEEGRWVQAWALMSLGDLSEDPAQAQAHFERSAALFRQLGDRAQLPVVLAHLAWFHLQQRHYALAETSAAESAALTEEIGDVMGAAWLQKLRGDLALAQQDHPQALARYEDALQRFRTLGSKSGIADALAALGKAFRAADRLEDARGAWTVALIYYEAMDQPGGGAYVHKWLEELAGLSR